MGLSQLPLARKLSVRLQEREFANLLQGLILENHCGGLFCNHHRGRISVA